MKSFNGQQIFASGKGSGGSEKCAISLRSAVRHHLLIKKT